MSESIYNLVPVDPEVEVKRKTPRAHKDPNAKVPNSTFGCHGTTRLLGAGRPVLREGAYYGPPKEEFGLTSSAARSPGRRDASPIEERSSRVRTRPAVPSKNDRPIMGITTSKNFVTANAVEAILQVPKARQDPELNYMSKEDFGRIPAYLTQVKEEIRRENEMIERYVKEQMGEVEQPPEEFEEMTAAERSDLIRALKAKWDHTNAQYQRISHKVDLDSDGQIRRKEHLENELTQLETDIERLQRASDVLIRA